MNGVNGTMEEPMNTSPCDFELNPDDLKKVAPSCDYSENHCGNSNNTENSNHLDDESSQDPTGTSNLEDSGNEHESYQDPIGTSNVEDSGNEHSNDSLAQAEQSGSTEPASILPDQDSNNISAENNCSNSNESYADSIASPRSKLEPVAKLRIQSIEAKSQDGDSEKDFGVTSNIHEESDEVDSEEDSSDDSSVMSAEPKADETLISINSDSDLDDGDDTSQESQSKNKNSDIIILESENRPDSLNGNQDSASPEVHEIISDNEDCVVTNEKSVETKTQLRRSSRALKRKRYDDNLENRDESDIEEVMIEDPLYRKSKPIVINDTKSLVSMAVKRMKKTHQSSKPNKEPTVVIIDTNTIIGKNTGNQNNKNAASSNSSVANQNLYQSIVARGTTVTPVSSKTSSTTQSPPQATPQPSILPSLTDDMFVVEAPSFIVPYVYEKPSLKPFREFVDILGKELDEQRAKEEEDRLQKEKEEKEKREKEKAEKKERGEPVSDSEDEKKTKAEEEKLEEKKIKKAEKRERRRRRNEDDDASWDGESSSESDDDLSDDDEKTVVIKDKADSIEEIKDVTGLTVDKVSSGKSDNYFDCSLGKFFINIGLNLVQEFVQTDLLKQQNRKLYREKKSGHSTKATESSINSLMKNLEFSKENNAPYTFPQKKCEFCSFKSESMLVMSHHLETPHMKNNVYKCNYCAFEIRSPHDILYHMEAEHNVRGKLERAPAYHQCPNCTFEDNGKGKLARHQIPCAKKFKPELNLSPPVEWEPPAKIPKIAKPRNNMMGSYGNTFNRGQMGSNFGRPAQMSIGGMPSGINTTYRPRCRVPGMSGVGRGSLIHGSSQVRGVLIRQSAPAPVLTPSNYPPNNGKSKPGHQPSISITPLPRQPQPVIPQPSQHSKSTFVICEICDGYIKDLEQLRNHMHWIHKVKIHPKMIYNRPPLNCQKCQFRFFTDQGLERHLLGSHGLVTSSMQEAANKGKDAGRCPVCGRVYQWKLLNHVAKDHGMTLKPAHLSYKCTVCTATFGMYKQFENHVYSAHSVVAKRVMDKSKNSTPPAKTNNSLLKPLKINDEITIIPQPAKSSSAKE